MINNKKLNFLVDTGASVTIIDKKIANTITSLVLSSEIPHNYRQEFSSITTVSGRLESHQFTLLKPTTFFIGTKEINDSDLWVSLDLSLVTQSIGMKIDGIIGIDTFRRFNWKVDNNKKMLSFLKLHPLHRIIRLVPVMMTVTTDYPNSGLNITIMTSLFVLILAPIKVSFPMSLSIM